MKLRKIEIISFRSIVNQSVNINENCISLIGLNESGKSNVLNAIRSLNNNYSLNIKDKSKINNELPKVKFIFDVDTNDFDDLKEELDDRLREIVKLTGYNLLKSVSVSEYQFTKQLVKDGSSYSRLKNSTATFDFELEKDYLKLKKDNKISDSTMIKQEDKSFQLNKIPFLPKSLIPAEYQKNYEPINKSDINIILQPDISTYFDSLLPSVIYWEFSEKYLLPSEITYEDFLLNDDPYENSAPLFNIFSLTVDNIRSSEDLKSKIVEWENDSSLRRRDEAIINETINKYIKSIWHDYDQELNIELEESKITIHFNDPESPIKNYYEMNSRSQGFKTFISFILNIAAEADNDSIEDFILVLDEPETHLHPSGVRFMKNELLKLSQTNIVVYATHSIFMIDRINLKRHILVSKKNEQTNLKIVERNNIMQESVIYEALGTTLDEFSISNFNIVFEGETDLLLFNSYFSLCFAKRDNVIDDYELQDGGGTKNIKLFFKSKIVPRDSKWILILDNDSPGRKLKDELLTIDKNLKNNLEFHYYSSQTDYELEDILPASLIQAAVSKTCLEKNITPGNEFNIDNKSHTQALAEFKGRNKIESSMFEESFKSNLKYLIEKEIEKISKKSTIEMKKSFFIETFPKYFEFISHFEKNFKDIPRK